MIVLHEKGARDGVELVRFSPDGGSLLAAANNCVRIWSGLPSPGPPKVLSEVGYVRNAQFTPDGTKVVTDRHPLTVIDLVAGTSQQVALWNPWRAFFNLTPDGRHVLIAQNNRANPAGWVACCPVSDPTPKAAVWSRVLQRPLRHPPTCLTGDRFFMTESWWEPSLTRTVFSYVTCSVKTGQVLTAVEGPDTGWPLPVVSPDGQLVAGVLNSRMVILSIEDFSKPVATLRNDNRKHFTGVAFHPSGRYLAATSNDATVKLYDTTIWKVAKTFTWDVGRMRSVAFSPDGTLAAAGSDKGKVVVWDVDV